MTGNRRKRPQGWLGFRDFREGSAWYKTGSVLGDTSCRFDNKCPCFRDYFYKQRVELVWPYMVGWRPLRAPATVGNTEAESRVVNDYSAGES